MNEAKTKAKDTIEESEMRAKQIVADMEDRVKGLLDQYKKLESTRDDMIGELKRLASDVLDKVGRATANTKDFDADHHLSNMRREAKKIAFPNLDYERPARMETAMEDTTEGRMDKQEVPAEPQTTQKSFFDEVG